MKTTKYVLIAIIINLFFSCYLGAQEEIEPVQAEASFNKEAITIGEKVRYAIRIELEEETELKLPTVEAVLNEAGFAVRDFGEEKQKKISKGRFREEYWYSLDTYVTGSYVVPPIVIEYILADGIPGEVETPEVFLEVKSVIKEGEAAEDIKDIKQPVEIKFSYKKFIILAVAIIIFIVFLVIIVSWLVKRRHKVKAQAVIPPYVIALRELEKARAMPLEDGEEIKEYYIFISGIIRHYIENRLGISAPEQTTEEFLKELTTAANLSEPHKALLRQFLKHCDMVKFAKYGPNREEIEGVWATARKFVEETIPDTVQSSE